jgi:hypothetical protein
MPRSVVVVVGLFLWIGEDAGVRISHCVFCHTNVYGTRDDVAVSGSLRM